MPKSWTLTINQQPLTLILAPPPAWGKCFKCQTAKGIRIISKHPLWIGDIQTYEERKFCWSCSLDNLYELETGDYEFKNKKAVITNIRQQLMVADTKEVYE